MKMDSGSAMPWTSKGLAFLSKISPCRGSEARALVLIIPPLNRYNEIIRQPMDLGTIRALIDKTLTRPPDGSSREVKVAAEAVARSGADGEKPMTLSEFAYLVRLTLSNAMLFNPAEHEVHEAAKELGMVRDAFCVDPCPNPCDIIFFFISRRRRRRHRHKAL